MTRTLAAITLLALLAASRATAQQSDTLPVVPPLRLRQDTLRVYLPPELVGAGRLAAPRSSPASLAQRWADSLRARLLTRAAARWRVGLTGDSDLLAVPTANTETPLSQAVISAAETGRRGATVISQYADIGLQLTARFELRLDRLRNLRCTAAEANFTVSGCQGGFTPPKLDPQFNVRTGGVVGQRVHVNVDYDSQREFEASNNIQVFYQGLEDEIVRRVQVGNVTFAAPSSRFITGGIPANNFGFTVEGQIGAFDWGAIFAQQKGNVVRGRTFTIGDRTVQPLDREVQDRDFEPLRFFFVADPASLPGFPAVDVLNLSLAGLPPSTRVTQVRIYRRRSTLGRTTAEQTLGGIEAVALRTDSPQRAGPFPWELLTEGRDYYLDASGLWFALTNRLDQDDYLAVSYVTAAGDTVGTFPATSRGGRTDTLRLIYEPRRAADVPTFRYEMRNSYRIGSADDVLRETSRLQILVSESERPASGAPTFLALLGISQTSDPTSFDQYNRLWPRQRDPAASNPVKDYFVFFPHLNPFADSTRLPQQFRNDSLYRTPTYLLRTQGPTPLYGLRMHYDARGGSDRKFLALGGIQIREGSEKITAGGRQLVRNTDYTINYEIGQVTFLAPDTLFRQPTQVAVQYEENPAFAIAPTSIYGLQTRYDFGDHGSMTAIGLLQRQRTTFTRPPLGFEPQSNFIGGVSGSFRFEPRRLTQLLDGLPFVHTEAPSLITLDAELATSRPSPNQVGVAYVETFESEGGSFLPLGEQLWEYGSRPSSATGLTGTGIDPVTGFKDADAVPMVWQNLIAAAGSGIVQFRARDIDHSIVVQGTGEQAETVLWMTLYPDTIGGLPDPSPDPTKGGLPRWYVPHTPGPRWRSMSQALSATGVDLSRTEFLEFWVFEDQRRTARDLGASMVFDFGTVFEDAVDFQPTQFTVTAQGDTVYSGRRRSGQGRLDTERDTLTNAFNAAINDHGILGDVADSILNATADTLVRNLPLCESQLGRQLFVYSWGSLLQRCTRKNGRADTEDLNNDQHLDTLITAGRENLLRYVFRIGDDRFKVRDGGAIAGADSGSGGVWRLYRIPFRSPLDTVGLPNIRQVQALRITVTAPEAGLPERAVFFALARMKLVGAPWVKRAATPIAGLAGSRGAAHGEVIASVVTTENFKDLGYLSPPGVVDEGANLGGIFQVGTTQINEKSLRLVGSDVRPGERAEAFFHFSEGERNFLGYRQFRVWARGRGSGWDNNQLEFYVKVAQDENNFYLYRTPARTTTWEPEVVVDFNRWLALRAAIETRYLRGDPPAGAAACGGDTLAYVACDGPYVVHVRNPGVAPPNLSRVQELAVGFLRDSGNALDSAELWVDDIRLTQVVNDAGYAGAVNLHVVAADVADLTLGMTRRDAQFRQLGEDPSYVTTSGLTLASSVRLEKLGLERLGVALPFTYQTTRSSTDPYFLNRTDVLGGEIQGLRKPQQSSSSYSIAFRRVRRGNLWWQRALIDNLTLGGSVSQGSSTSELATSSSRFTDVHGDYAIQPGDLSFHYLPRFLRRLLEGLPGFLRGSDFARGLEDGRLRLTPALIQLSSGLSRSTSDRQTFRLPIRTPGDSLIPSTRAQTATLRNRLSVGMRPLGSVDVGFDLASDRDLRDYGDSTTIGLLAGQSRSRFLGLDVGFERTRSLAARFSYAPPLFSWFRPRYAVTSSFGLQRDPNASTPERTGSDSTGGFRLPSAFTNAHAMDIGGPIDFSRALAGMLRDSTGLRRAFDRFQQLDVSFHTERRSQFDRPGFDPSLSYQLGLGGRDAFRQQGGRFATSASESRSTRVASGVRLPLGFSVTANYTLTTALVWSLRLTRQQETRTTDTDWPNFTARWTWTPQQAWLRRVLTSLSANASLHTRTSESVQPPLPGETGGPGGAAAGGVRTSQESKSQPVSLTLNVAPRIVTNLSYSTTRTRTDRAGNLTFNDVTSAAADVSFAFRPPPDVVPLRSDVRTSLRYGSSVAKGCIQRADAEECIPFSDSRRHEYHLTMDTDMPPNVTAALSVGYVLTEDAHANRKFSQLTVTAAVSVSFVAGEIR